MHGIPVPPLWVRRVQRVLWPLVGVLVSVVAGFACVVSLVLWPIDRRMRLARFALAITEALWADIRLTVACWRLWLRHPRGDSPTWRADHQELLARTLNSVIGAGQRYLGLRVRFAGPVDLNSPHIPDLVLARHAGPADSLILAWLLTHEAVRLPRVVLTEGLRWDPGVDIVLSRLDSYFVPSVTGAGDDRVDRVRELARSRCCCFRKVRTGHLPGVSSSSNGSSPEATTTSPSWPSSGNGCSRRARAASWRRSAPGPTRTWSS